MSNVARGGDVGLGGAYDPAGRGGAIATLISFDAIQNLVHLSFVSNRVERGRNASEPLEGSAIYVNSGFTNPRVHLSASLLSGAATNATLVHGRIGDLGFNISDAPTPAFTLESSRNNLNPLLQLDLSRRLSIARPAPGSPAIGHVTTNFAATDIRGAIRHPASNDAGAFDTRASTPITLEKTNAQFQISAPAFFEPIKIFASSNLTAWTEVGWAPLSSNYTPTLSISNLHPNAFFRAQID